MNCWYLFGSVIIFTMMSDIMELLDSKEVILEEGENCYGKSEVWEKFRFLVYRQSETYTGYVLCCDCRKPMKHNKALSGTTHLRNHMSICSGSGEKKQPKITGFFRKDHVPKSSKDKVFKAAIAFAANDMRPISAIEGKGFQQLANALIEVGAKHGRVEAKSVLPCRNTLKRKIETVADDMRKIVLKEVKDAISNNRFIGMTTDMWTDIKCRHFISLTVHYVRGMELRCHILTVYQFEGKKSGENIKKSIADTLKMFSLPLSSVSEKVFFVSDNGSNIKVALADFNRLPCACHMLATVLSHTLQLQTLSKTIEVIPENSVDMEYVIRIRELVSSVKTITAYVKRTGMNNRLTKGLKQSVDTRWNSTFTMLQAFNEAQGELEDLLRGSVYEAKFLNIDWVLLSTLLEFLIKFAEVTNELEGDLSPTIQKVYQCNHALELSMAPSITDSAILSFLKRRGLVCLKEKFVIHDLHLLALFLNPMYKSLVPLAPAKRSQIHNMAHCLIKDIELYQPVDGWTDEQPPSTSASVITDHAYGLPAPKRDKLKTFDDDFLHWQESTALENRSNEIDEYISSSFDKNSMLDSDKGFRVLRFWTDGTTILQFPKLSRLAVGVLSIPASSASSERVFSLCGNTVNKKRSVMSASTLDALLVLQSAGEEICLPEPSTST